MNRYNKLKFSKISIVIFLTFYGSFIYAMNSGIRNNYGIMLQSIVKSSGLSFASVSFVLAVGQLIFGLVMPIFGIMASKKGYFKTLTTGTIFTVLGMLLTPYCKSIITLTLCLGIILPAGTGVISYGFIMGAITPKLPKNTISTVSGIINASSGIGNTIMSPMINSMILSGGMLYTMLNFSLPMVLTIPLAHLMCKNNKKIEKIDMDSINNKILNTNISYLNDDKKHKIKEKTTKEIFLWAFSNKTYLLMMIGFFTCGFHMAIITNHLPNEFLSLGFTSQTSANVFAIFGLTTMIGSVFSGWLCDRYKKKNVLGTIFGIRPLIILFFILAPKIITTITIFSAILGFTGASTVPPVSGLISSIFTSKNMATLFGFIFFVHQIGGFAGAWVGGICFDITGSYITIWIINLILSLIASIFSYMIRDSY